MGGMKIFYAAIGGIAVVGFGALFWARSSASTLPSDPIPTAAVEAAKGFGGYVLGTDSAPVEIVEFADFQCPACKGFWVLTMPDVRQRLIATGKVRWVFRDFPLDAHDKSRLAHHAAACAGEQGLFWPMHDKLYERQAEWSSRGRAEKLFESYAEAVGADAGQYDQCMSEGRYRARLQASYEQSVSVGVTSTPSFLIGNRIYSGALPFDPLRALVDSLAAAHGR
jgi:protein-disulfide isomerase